MRGTIPRKIKGFRDIEPDLNRLRWKIIHSASEIYRLYGYEHWDTPVLEYADCLGKYLPDTDTVEEGIYSFQNPEIEPVLQPDGKELRDRQDHTVMEHHFVTLRYDLTAPLARHYAESLWVRHLRGQLNPQKPPLFRRYQYGPVFRYEAKLDPGRFREFWQMDFDSVGTADAAADAEVAVVLCDALEAIGLPRQTYILKVNNRKILQAFLAHLGIAGAEAEQAILRVIDKMEKIGLDGVREELGVGRVDVRSGAGIPGLGLEKAAIQKIAAFLQASGAGEKRRDVLKNLEQSGIGSTLLAEGLGEMQKIDEVLTALGYDEERVVFEPTLVRGMTYYTGPVFEVDSLQTFSDDKGRPRKVGSICGGGRYDGLVENLLGLKVPATGASIGVDRLAELLMLTRQLTEQARGPVLVVVFDDALMPEYQKIAQQLRQENIDAEVYYGAQRGLKKQLSYADQKNSPLAVLLGEDELKKGVVTLRDLRLGEQISAEVADKEEWKRRAQFEVPRADLVKKILEII
jgi:histidyl-tRNA synthetase